MGGGKIPYPVPLFQSEYLPEGLKIKDYRGFNNHCWGLGPMMITIGFGFVVGAYYMVRLCYKPPDVEMLGKLRPQPYESQPQAFKYRSWTNLNYDTIKVQEERLNVGDLPSMSNMRRMWNKDEYY